MLSTVGTHESWRKEVHRPATSTHKWWAKRLGSVFRGIIVAATTEQGGDAAAAYSCATRLTGTVVLDPFAGSGVTGVEAIKLGATAICMDINPVATLVQRQALQPWDLAALYDAYARVERASHAEVDRVHRTEDGRTVLYYFWVATAVCPQCAVKVNLFDSTVYSKDAYPKRKPRAQLVCPECLDIQEGRFDFKAAICAAGHEFSQAGPVERSKATCRNGHSFKIVSALGDRPPEYEMYSKMVANARGEKSYEPITQWDRALYMECENLLEQLPDSAVLPRGSLTSGNNTNQALKWNFREWRQFFNARQLYSLSIIATAIRDLDGLSAEREALCALFSGALEFNNLFASFKGEGTGAVRHMFSNHVLKPERTPLEAHPWGTPQSSGAFSTLLKSRIERAHNYKEAPIDLTVRHGNVARTAELSTSITAPLREDWMNLGTGGAYVVTRSAADTGLADACVDLVITDPPFMDNVHYAELADFFHSWLREMRPHADYPSDDTTRRAGEVQNADPAEFGKAIEAVWVECERLLKHGGLLAFTYHQARISGWARLIEALHRAGFVVTAIQPVKGEMTTSVVKAGASEPSNLDSIVVCRRAADGATSPHSSLDQAFEYACAQLGALRDAGVDVGKGDVRSVVRGTLLAHLAAEGVTLDDACQEVVDRLASQAVEALAEGQRPRAVEHTSTRVDGAADDRQLALFGG
ncbi:DNA methyltransferase [Hamadaea flava]|nr:DNA methyltransferase [Hamadaea flava]